MSLYKISEFEIVPRRKKVMVNSLNDQMVAISKTFLHKFSGWTPEQKSLFCMCLTKIRWTEEGNSNVVELDNEEIIDALKLSLDADHRSPYLRKAFKELAKQSWIEWTDKTDPERYEDGFIIIGAGGKRGKRTVTFNPVYMPLLENLKKNFITVWTTDAFSFKSPAAWNLFIDLRTHCDTRKTNYRDYTTEQLMEVLGLPKDAYRRKDGFFARTLFERKALDKAIEEINAGEMLQILPEVGGKGKCYLKTYKYGYVDKYQFKYVINPQQVPSEEQRLAEGEDRQLDGQMDFKDFPEIMPNKK